MKKLEKVRIIKEDQLIDAMFSFKNATAGEKKEFERLSYSIMAKIDARFIYSIQQKGVFEDISDLFKQFLLN